MRPTFNFFIYAVGAENARTGKTMAEKMVKIMEERLKEKAAVTEKLHSKNHALKVLLSSLTQATVCSSSYCT